MQRHQLTYTWVFLFGVGGEVRCKENGMSFILLVEQLSSLFNIYLPSIQEKVDQNSHEALHVIVSTELHYV